MDRRADPPRAAWVVCFIVLAHICWVVCGVGACLGGVRVLGCCVRALRCCSLVLALLALLLLLRCTVVLRWALLDGWVRNGVCGRVLQMDDGARRRVDVDGNGGLAMARGYGAEGWPRGRDGRGPWEGWFGVRGVGWLSRRGEPAREGPVGVLRVSSGSNACTQIACPSAL